MEVTSKGDHSPYMAVGGVSKNSCGACADLEYSGISTLGQETFVPTVKIPLFLSLPVSRYLTLSIPSPSTMPSRTRSRARGQAQGGSGRSGPGLRGARELLERQSPLHWGPKGALDNQLVATSGLQG